MSDSRVVVISVDELEQLVERSVRRVLEQRDTSPPPASEWLDRKEAAELLGMHPDTVRKLEQLPVHRVGSRLRYHRGDVERFIREKNAPPRHPVIQVDGIHAVLQNDAHGRQTPNGRR